jgi:arabinoxylan arabinofuranohydrolase
MKGWRLYSSADMANWQDHGVVASLSTFSLSTERAWAGQVIARNGKLYYYFPTRHGTGNMAVGMAVSNNITGPYKDALGKPLVQNGNIDPTVMIDDDDQAYLYCGYPLLFKKFLVIFSQYSTLLRNTFIE